MSVDSPLLDLNNIPFPPAPPQPCSQWLAAPALSHRREAPQKVAGWLLHIPGFLAPEFFINEERAKARHDYLTRFLRSRSYLRVEDGNLMDCRSTPPKLLRKDYEDFFPRFTAPRQLAATLRALKRMRYSEHIYFLTGEDGVLCQTCVRENWWLVAHAMTLVDDYEFQVTGWDVRHEGRDDVVICDHCNEEIPLKP